MKSHIKLSFLTSLIVLFGIMACNKDESIDEPEKNNLEKIIGTWQITDGNYNGTITFEEGSLLAFDYFTSDTLAGVGFFEWRLNEDQLTLTLLAEEGDYDTYNEMTTNSIINAVVGITDNELTINTNSETYIYSRLAPEKFVDKTDIEGTWESVEGDYRGLITFDINSDMRDNLGVESFTATTNSGATNFVWDITGNMIFVNYDHMKMYGDYSDYNEVANDDLTIAKVNATDTELTFTVGGESYVYTRFSNENVVSKSDLIGTWKKTEGTLSEVISFEIINRGGAGNVKHSFIDGDSKGYTEWNYWTISGDLFTIEYQSLFEDDYSSYYGVTIAQSQTMDIAYTNNQITFSDSDGDYIYTRINPDEIINSSDLTGTWTRADANYSGTLIFTGDDTVSDSFTDEAQSGTAEIAYDIHGDILRLKYLTMNGDYESYNGYSINENNYSFIGLTGNQLTITNDGIDYIYTKSSN